jgi:4-carboxymuconolactone decarboxylase
MDTSKYNETEAFMAGLKVREEVLGPKYVGASVENGAKDEFTKTLQQFVTETAWGTVWLREGLDRKTRSMLNLAMLAALGREGELRLHTRGAINNGCTKEEIAEIFLQAAVYAGAPAAVSAFKTAKEAFDDMGI